MTSSASPPAWTRHSCRRSYTTHLLEDGIDTMFFQHQLGHEHASTTEIYTHVSSDYRTRTLRHALDTILTETLGADRTTDDTAGRGRSKVVDDEA